MAFQDNNDTANIVLSGDIGGIGESTNYTNMEAMDLTADINDLNKELSDANKEVIDPDSTTSNQAPEFTHRLSVYEEVTSGSKVVLECGCPAGRNSIYTWFLDDMEVTQGPRILVECSSEVQGQDTLRLIIEDVKKSDEGAYKCRAENSKGVATTTGYLSITEREQSSSGTRMNEQEAGSIHAEPAAGEAAGSDSAAHEPEGPAENYARYDQTNSVDQSLVPFGNTCVENFTMNDQSVVSDMSHGNSKISAGAGEGALGGAAVFSAEGAIQPSTGENPVQVPQDENLEHNLINAVMMPGSNLPEIVTDPEEARKAAETENLISIEAESFNTTSSEVPTLESADVMPSDVHVISSDVILPCNEERHTTLATTTSTDAATPEATTENATASAPASSNLEQGLISFDDPHTAQTEVIDIQVPTETNNEITIETVNISETVPNVITQDSTNMENISTLDSDQIGNPTAPAIDFSDGSMASNLSHDNLMSSTPGTYVVATARNTEEIVLEALTTSNTETTPESWESTSGLVNEGSTAATVQLHLVSSAPEDLSQENIVSILSADGSSSVGADYAAAQSVISADNVEATAGIADDPLKSSEIALENEVKLIQELSNAAEESSIPIQSQISSNEFNVEREIILSNEGEVQDLTTGNNVSTEATTVESRTGNAGFTSGMANNEVITDTARLDLPNMNVQPVGDVTDASAENTENKAQETSIAEPQVESGLNLLNQAADLSDEILESKVNIADNLAPTAESIAHSIENMAPTTENMAPAVENMAPTEENMAPAVENMAPTAENMAPAAKNMANTAENMAPTAENMAPTAENMAPTTENMAPTTENVVSSDQLLMTSPGSSVIDVFSADNAATPVIDTTISNASGLDDTDIFSPDNQTPIITETTTDSVSHDSSITSSDGAFRSTELETTAFPDTLVSQDFRTTDNLDEGTISSLIDEELQKVSKYDVQAAPSQTEASRDVSTAQDWIEVNSSMTPPLTQSTPPSIDSISSEKTFDPAPLQEIDRLHSGLTEEPNITDNISTSLENPDQLQTELSQQQDNTSIKELTEPIRADDLQAFDTLIQDLHSNEPVENVAEKLFNPAVNSEENISFSNANLELSEDFNKSAEYEKIVSEISEAVQENLGENSADLHLESDTQITQTNQPITEQLYNQAETKNASELNQETAQLHHQVASAPTGGAGVLAADEGLFKLLHLDKLMEWSMQWSHFPWIIYVLVALVVTIVASSLQLNPALVILIVALLAIVSFIVLDQIKRSNKSQASASKND